MTLSVEEAYDMLDRSFAQGPCRANEVVYWPSDKPQGSVTISHMEWSGNGSRSRRIKLLQVKHRRASEEVAKHEG